MIEPQDFEKILGLIDTAKTAVLRDILQKVSEKKALTPQEMKTLNEYEQQYRLKMKKEFSNLTEVHEYLEAEGFKIALSTLYKHGKAGYILADKKTGVYTLPDVRKYARRFLALKETREAIEDDELHRKKLRAEVERIEEQTRREKIRRMADEGLYIPRADAEQELAARAGIMDQAWTYLFHTRAPEIIDLVEGDPKKASELIVLLTSWKDEVLNEFASIREFEVLFKATLKEEA